jgi:two-component system sensor histidine kinase/response regulator
MINYRKDGSEFWVDFEIVPVTNERGCYTHWVSVQRDITERKQVEEELRKSEERWQLVIKANNDGIWDFNLKTNQVFRSARYEEILGYQEGELGFDNNDWVGRIHPDDFERVIKANQDYLERKIPNYAVEYRQRCKDGNYKWVLSRAQAIWDETGTAVRMVGSTGDISDRKQIEEALYKSEERFHLALSNSEIGLWDWNVSTGQVYFDPQWKKMLGYEIEEIENSFSSWERLVHPEDLQRAFLAINAHFENVTPIYEVEFRMLSKSGQWKWILSRGKLTERDEFGKPVRITGTHKDISDRKQAELETVAAKEALESQINRVLLSERITQEIRSSLQPEQIFEIAASQIGEAFSVERCLIHTYIDHPSPRVPIVGEYKQPGLESLIGLEIPVIGNPHAELLLSQDLAVASDNVYTDPLLEAASPIALQLNLKSMLAVRTSYQGKTNGVIAIHQYDHFRHWTDDEIEVIESLGAQLGIAIAQANLLEQEKQQRRELAAQNHALEKAKIDAEAANNAKTQFLSKMSHELRTPLNAILGFSQLMVRDESLSRNQLEYLNIINRSGQHLLELINDILSMAKIEAGQVTLNQTCFDLYGLLESLEAMLQMKAVSKGLYLTFEKSENLPQYIQTDESKLRQVLINLLGNAIKFTQKGRITLRARGGVNTLQPILQSLNSQFLITFEVEDTGPGIAPEEIVTLFEPFVQTETGRKSMEGTGLGLPISQQFVHLMGGDITVSSTLGRGTIFTFDIQVGKASAADEKPQSNQSRVISLEPNQPSYRILIVEDVLENRLLLLKLLENLGFEVQEAVNGQEGIAIWENWSPHLIFMDILMPIMDGYEATKQIKQTPHGQDTVIIALTASAFEEQRETVLKSGCDDFMPKPFQEEELLDKIAHHLKVRYLYEDRQAGESSQSSALVEQLTKESLKVMPEDWVKELHQASLYADDELINQLIDQIPLEYESLCRGLKDLLDNFRLDKLIELSESEEP